MSSLRHLGVPAPGARAIRVFVALVFVQLLLHLFHAFSSHDPRLLPPHLVAWLHDTLVLSLTLLPLRLALLALPARARPAGESAAAAILAVAGALLSLYPQMLREYLSFPVNLFAGNAASAAMLIREYLGFERLAPALLAAIAAIAALFAPPLPPRLKWVSRLAIAAWGLLLVAGALAVPRSPQPVVSSLNEELAIRSANAPREVPRLRPARRRQSGESRPIPAEPKRFADAKATHLFLIVLEGVTAAEFEKEFMRGRSSRFYGRVATNSLYFANYYTNNLDSYTSLIAMLTSQQVPYRSYTDTTLYDAVNQSANLARDFRQSGFRSSFVSTYDTQPFVPVRNEWTGILHRRDLPTQGEWLTVESGRMESATEDRAAIPTITSLAKSNPKTFVLQELAWGHTTAWRAKTGLTTLAYYDKYFNELLDRLVADGSWARSLIVIVSDHGDRFEAAKASNYRVPLLIVGPGVTAGRDTALRSHIDLRQIVAAFVGGEDMPEPRQRILVTGSTERWVYGEIDEAGGALFIDDKSGRVLSRRGALDPAAVNRAFQGLIDRFGQGFGR
ncbi:sulfatase [Chlorobaculum sp. 24CR]|uniref:sulfatase-like hydrolase/transferase n=1 Tax=Chlorobaculum sp. 24CR TaxID=2508878 RepID=UPI00100B7AE8|nr:sulfatase-like hydrolase/transferase [Chlorobaculum sp. 24CR]RXK87523.1 sulfatase [Chlorobaculum sp. 24CR]